MFTLKILLIVAGIIHLGIITAGITMTRVLDWRTNLACLSGLTRHVIWTHGAFVLMTIIAFGAVSLAFPSELASGTPLARGVCAFIAAFWGIRLLIQFFLFDARPYLTSRVLAIGYHGLTLAFAYFTIVYTLAAMLPSRP